LVGKATTDTLTNKTLTGAVMNGTVGAITPSTGAFTTLSATGMISKGTTTGAPTAGDDLVLQTTGYTGITLFGGAAEASTVYFRNQAAPTVERGYLQYDFATSLMTIGSNTAVTGLVDISAASSGQIKFPATQNASTDGNTLDDYEEGTFTPILAATGGGTATYSAQVGRYRKIGSFVCVWARVNLATVGTLSGSIVVASLPFTSQNATNYFSLGTILLENTVFSGSPTAFINPNDTNAYIISSVSGAGSSLLNATGLTSSTTVTITICYHTA
jgi:hypothetical protein